LRRIVENAAGRTSLEGISVLRRDSSEARPTAWLGRADNLIPDTARSRALADVGVAPPDKEEHQRHKGDQNSQPTDDAAYYGAGSKILIV
jgi:hypothetical protein